MGFERLFLEDDLTGCWFWQGALNPDGYPLIKDGSRVRLAHRVVWKKLKGPIPDGMELHHTCEERTCINPDHLEPKYHAKHSADHGEERSAKRETCANGHPWKDNLAEYVQANGNITRRCKECRRIENRLYYRKKTLGF